MRLAVGVLVMLKVMLISSLLLFFVSLVIEEVNEEEMLR